MGKQPGKCAMSHTMPPSLTIIYLFIYEERRSTSFQYEQCAMASCLNNQLCYFTCSSTRKKGNFKVQRNFNGDQTGGMTSSMEESHKKTKNTTQSAIVWWVPSQAKPVSSPFADNADHR
jgi:hypothetical protein